ncbi:MAG: regulatory protein RecX [Limnobacter sp.]|nr:regulatory protein RecX [Limnobacter sp.]
MPRPKPSAKAKAISYLARREHSRTELTHKLEKAGYEVDQIQEAIDWVTSHQFQSDERFTHSLARRRASTFGDRAINAELAQHGLSGASTIDSSTDESLPGEYERVLQWLSKRYRHKLPDLYEASELDQDALFKLKAKAYRALASRGFEFSHIDRAWKDFLREFLDHRC